MYTSQARIKVLVMNVQSNTHVPSHSFLQRRSGTNRLFNAMSNFVQNRGTNGAEAKDEGIPCHIVYNTLWVDADAMIKEIGANINAQNDIMAPSAALDEDSVRTVAGKNYISAPALVRRMRMNERSRDFAITVIKNFLTSAVGVKELNIGERIGDHYVDMYVPRAKIAVDVNGGTLTSSTLKRVYLERKGIALVVFHCGSTQSHDDVERLMNITIPALFSALMSRYKAGSMRDSAIVSNHFTDLSNSSTFKAPSALKRGYIRDAPYVSRRF